MRITSDGLITDTRLAVVIQGGVVIITFLFFKVLCDKVVTLPYWLHATRNDIDDMSTSQDEISINCLCIYLPRIRVDGTCTCINIG